MANGINAIGNLQGKVDSNNQLVVALGSGSVLPSDVEVDAGSGTANAGIGGVLTVSTTSAQTGANTTETDLWTYSLPANTLSADGYGIKVAAYGGTAANANTKTFKMYFGGTTLMTFSATNNIDWMIVADIVRTGATTQVASSFRLVSGGLTVTATAPAETLSGAVTLRVTGQNAVATAGDAVFRFGRVEFLRPGS